MSTPAMDVPGHAGGDVVIFHHSYRMLQGLHPMGVVTNGYSHAWRCEWNPSDWRSGYHPFFAEP